MKNRIKAFARIRASDLVPHPKNWRTHGEDQRAALRSVLDDVGITGAILVRKLPGAKYQIIDGHLRAETMPNEEIPALVLDVTEAEAEKVLASHDPLALMAGVDKAALAELAASVQLGGELDALLRELAGLDKKPSINTDPDTIPERAGEHRAERGQLWGLGAHILLVGDCTKPKDLARVAKKAALVLTDPPYAIYGSSTGVGSDVADDGMVQPFFEGILRTAFELLPWFGHCYAFCDWRSWSAWWEAAKRARLTPKNCITWDKGDGGLGNNYANCTELIGYYAKIPPARYTRGPESTGQRQILRPNIMRFPRTSGADRLHNAAKPVALVAELVENSSNAGDTVVDLFCGSGTTIIACEQTGRVCATLEKDPATAGVAIERWEKFAGRKARLLKKK